MINKRWYSTVSGNLSKIPDFVAYYEAELEKASSETKVSGNLERQMAILPQLVETRFNQLQDIEAVLNYINIETTKVRRKYFQKYLEAYNRQLSSRDAEKYTDGEPEVIQYELLANEVALIRNQFLGIIKGLDTKAYQLNNITRLKCAGLDEASV